MKISLEEAELSLIAAVGERVRANIARVIIGSKATIDLLLVALLSEGHVLLEDVPGTGKTTMARALARSLDCPFRRIQFTPDLLPSDVSGLSFFNQKLGDFQFRPGAIFTSVLLADEINRATPRTQSALLEAMQERTVTLDGVTHELARPFLVIATQNPIELEGTFPLPEAQLDRFLMRLELGYPSVQDEMQLLERFEQDDPLATLEPVTDASQIMALQQSIRQVRVSEPIRRYIADIARASRESSDIAMAVSPRASLALARAAQAYAALQGRAFVLPDDIKALAVAVLAHRLILQPEMRLRGRSAADVIQALLGRVAVPVEG